MRPFLLVGLRDPDLLVRAASSLELGEYIEYAGQGASARGGRIDHTDRVSAHVPAASCKEYRASVACDAERSASYDNHRT